MHSSKMEFLSSFTYFVLLTSCGVCVYAQPSQEDLNAVTESIWAADAFRFPDDDVVVNEAGPILFQYVNEELLDQPVYAKYIALLDNYEPMIGTPETCGQPCRDEENAFLDEILDSPEKPMRIAHDFLVAEGLASASIEDFKDELRYYWFELYSRSGGAALDSSGFEHVFVGELRSGDNVLGFHNWLQTYLEEKEGEFVYDTYLDTCQPYQLKFSHEWMDFYKPINSLWIQASPDMEMAIFTVCFQARQGSLCNISLAGIPNQVTTYDLSGVTPRTISTAFPRC